MSTKKGTIGGHKFHGDPNRFWVVAEYVFKSYGRSVKRIADVAGGQGMLTRILRKKFNYDSQVIDPRGWILVGVPARKEVYVADTADYYDLIVGLHPDEALKEVVISALIRPVIVVPCCNFWNKSKRLGTVELLGEIEKFYQKYNIKYQKIEFDFSPPKNIGLVTQPPNL